MASENHFLHYLLIIGFAAGLVALGVEEIHTEYGQTGVSTVASDRKGTTDGESLSSRLRQGSATDRLRYPSGVKKEPSTPVESRRERASFKFPFFGEQREQPSAEDALKKSDRKELDSLIDEVVE